MAKDLAVLWISLICFKGALPNLLVSLVGLQLLLLLDGLQIQCIPCGEGAVILRPLAA